MQDGMVQGSRYLWSMPQSDNRVVVEIAARYNVSIPIAQTLVTRGFVEHEQIEAFLFSSFERDVADPTLLHDGERAVDRLLTAIEKGERILVFGDYDVDGMTSSALMMICLLPLGAKVNFFLPHRVRDGYGISTRIVERAARSGYSLIVTVDNGVTAFEPARRAKELGVDLIITDHHKQHDELPDAYALVNPNLNDCSYPFKGLAGVGVSFKILSLLYARKKMKMPTKAYELMLLGTVADVVPLLGENRFWVRYGLHHVNKEESFSLKVLKQNGKVTKPLITATDVGFSIAPQLNALGRLEDPRQGVRFLIGADQREVQEVGRILLEMNDARKEIERSILAQVLKQIESGAVDLEKSRIIVATSTQWPPGVIGLVASRLVSQFGRPAILLHETKDGKLKGSCRSIPELNMFDLLCEVKHLLITFGGHAQAAGLSLKVSSLAEFKQEIERIASERLTADDLVQKIVIDAQVQLEDLRSTFMHDMQQLEPFGCENRAPLFCVEGVSLVQQPRLLKDAHVKCSVFADGQTCSLMFFNRPELFEPLCKQGADPFCVAAQVTENHWNGRVTIELNGVDCAGLKEAE